MQTISCDPRYNLKEGLSWHRQVTQRYMQPKVRYVATSIPRKRAFHGRLRNSKIYALENKDASQLESAATSNERVGDKMFNFDNSVLLEGSERDLGIRPPKALSRNEGLLQNLKRYGASGILSYGLLSTVYYVGTFLFIWFYVAPTPGGMGYPAAAQSEKESKEQEQGARARSKCVLSKRFGHPIIENFGNGLGRKPGL